MPDNGIRAARDNLVAALLLDFHHGSEKRVLAEDEEPDPHSEQDAGGTDPLQPNRHRRPAIARIEPHQQNPAEPQREESCYEDAVPHGLILLNDRLPPL